MSDAKALAWLDSLLDLNDHDRFERLQRLSAEDPTLHARLLRLLTAAAAVDSSQVLARPIVDGLRAAQQSATLAFEPGQSLAGYRLLRELGRGGMSVVWLAERIDGVVKREVALKFPRFVLMSPIEVERFAREKDVLAKLTHPHIACLYDAGVAPSGQPFIVLEFVDGIPITEYCDRHQVAMLERLRLFLQVLAAVDHAHKHLVVHRDLKPSNILVDLQGQVKLLDFGIAKLLTEPAPGAATQLTQQGSVALTPLYAAPEQITAQPISTLTDVYVLGIVLFELLTGALPYRGVAGSAPSLPQVLDALMRGAPTLMSHAAIDNDAVQARSMPSLGRMRAMLAGDLDTIVSKAMRFEPAQRYNSVERLASDIRSFLAHLPIAARPPGAAYSARLFLRRHRSASVAASIGAVLFLTAAVVALYQYQESRAHEARTAIVRDFMFDLIDDAEPDESHPNAQVTGKQMLDGAVLRAHRNFGDQPELQGELLSELGRMYARLDERDSARIILTEALTLLEQNASSADPSLNKTRAQLADVLLKEGDVAHAHDLANVARDACTQENRDCAKARAYADGILSRVSFSEGNVEQSLVEMREAVRETASGFGEQDAESAMALLNLALIARNGGHLREAGAAMEKAIAISDTRTLPAADRTQLLRSAAVLDLDLGHYDTAEMRLTDLLSHTKNRTERTLQFRLLANSLLAQGEPAAALNAADTAIALAGSDKIDAQLLFARQVHAQALALAGRSQESLAEIQAVIEGLHEVGRSESSPEAFRARRIRAEILLRAGRAADAFDELNSLSTQLRVAPKSHELELGQTLDLLGCALRELNRATEAVPLHDQARVQLEKQLPAGHPFLDRNALYKEAASHNWGAFLEQGERMKRTLKPTSIWRALIDAQLNSSTCRAPGLSTCVLVL